jgi:PiT family inorganic phosphate transporter
MSDAALHARAGTGTIAVRPSLDREFDPRTAMVFLRLLGAGLLFVAYSLYADVDASGARVTTTIRNIALAWVLTLPMAMMLSAGLYILFLNMF